LLSLNFLLLSVASFALYCSLPLSVVSQRAEYRQHSARKQCAESREQRAAEISREQHRATESNRESNRATESNRDQQRAIERAKSSRERQLQGATESTEQREQRAGSRAESKQERDQRAESREQREQREQRVSSIVFLLSYGFGL
jgi:hypothetical protein